MAPHLLADEQESITAICSTLQKATVRIVSGTDLSSGVIVSTEGHVLTVAHGLHRETGKVTLIFHEGKITEAEILLRDTVADVAVLKLPENLDLSEYPRNPIGLSTVPENGQCVFASGFPGRERNGLSPVVRIGQLLAVEQRLLRSSCTLTVGDSGGPLVNHKGELIGLHRQIGLGNEANLHLRIHHIRDVVFPVLDLKAIAAHVRPPSIISSHLPVPSAAAAKALQQRSVEIRHHPDDPTPLSLGTMLDSLHVATKLSELTPEAEIFCRFHDQSSCAGMIAETDKAIDLAIVTLSQTQATVSPLSRGSDNHDGWQIVFASMGLNSVSRTGIVARSDHVEPSMAGKLGAVLESIDQGTVVGVKELVPNSTAAKAGLALRDRIATIDGQPVSTLDDVARSLQLRQPGDWLRFEFQSETQDRTSFARLQHDPGERFERTEFLDGRSGRVSQRRSGFEKTLQHDIPLAPEECGGPLCDLNGRIIGVTIARRARESSLALPINRVLQAAGIDSR